MRVSKKFKRILCHTYVTFPTCQLPASCARKKTKNIYITLQEKHRKNKHDKQKESLTYVKIWADDNSKKSIK